MPESREKEKKTKEKGRHIVPSLFKIREERPFKSPTGWIKSFVDVLEAGNSKQKLTSAPSPR